MKDKYFIIFIFIAGLSLFVFSFLKVETQTDISKISQGSAIQSLGDIVVDYPIPHRSWINVSIIASQYSLTADKIDWAASHVDYFVRGPVLNQYLSQYKAKVNAPMILYDNYYCLYVGQEKYNAMVKYVNDHGLNLEDMFLHFAENTTVTLTGETHVLPAGSRVPTYEWYKTGGDLMKNNARVVMNVGNQDYRAFIAEYELALVNALYNGASYDGLFIDNTGLKILSGQGGVTSGGTITEYPGKARAQAVTAYDDDIVKAFAAVRTAFGSKGAQGSKLQVPNCSYDARPELFPYIDAIFRESIIQPVKQEVSSLDSLIQILADANNAGIPSIVSVSGMGVTENDKPREKMTGLALYYIAASNNDYFCRDEDDFADPYKLSWYGALEYNIGKPKGNAYTFALGADPASPKRDSGVGTVTHTGSVYTITDNDNTKNWTPADYWVKTSLVDSANNIIPLAYHSGPNWISFYRSNAPYPVSGTYQIGTYVYKIYARQYDNALVLVKPMPSWAQKETGDPSATTHNLPSYTTADNKTSNRYYKLNVDGTLDSTPITQITLRNAEGVILAKADTTNPPPVVISPSPETSPVVSPETSPVTPACNKDLSDLSKYIPTYTGLELIYDVSKLNNFSDFLIKKLNIAEIQFLDKLNLIHEDANGCYESINMNSATQLSDKKVKIDSTSYPELNKKARIKFYNVNSAKTIIMRDGKKCIEPDCKIISYDATAHTLVIEVKGF